MSYKSLLSNLNLYHRLYRNIVDSQSDYDNEDDLNLYDTTRDSGNLTKTTSVSDMVPTINGSLLSTMSTTIAANRTKDLNIITYLFANNYHPTNTTASSSSMFTTDMSNNALFSKDSSSIHTTTAATAASNTTYTIFAYLTLSLLTISVILNLYICLSIYFGKNLKTRTNTLMQNIFVADLLFVLLSLPFDVQLRLLLTSAATSSSSSSSLTPSKTLLPTSTTTTTTTKIFSSENIIIENETLWFGQLFCKTIPSLQIVTELVIAITITIIAIDKCQSICTKYSCRITNVISIPLINKLIWLASFLGALPVILYSKMVPLIDNSRSSIHWSSAVCKFDYSKMIHENDEQNNYLLQSGLIPLTITFIYFVMLYCGPMLIIAGCYAKIYIRLYHYRHRYSNVHDIQKRIRTSDRETVRTLAFVATTFAICWLPYHLLQIFSQISLTGIRRQTSGTIWPPPIYLSIQMLIIVGTILNPVLYLIWSKSIREHFKENILSLIRVPLKIFKKTSIKSSTSSPTSQSTLSEISSTTSLRTCSMSSTMTTTESSSSSSTSSTSSTCSLSRLLSCIFRWRSKVHDNNETERENQLQNNQKKNSLQKLLPTYSREDSI